MTSIRDDVHDDDFIRIALDLADTKSLNIKRRFDQLGYEHEFLRGSLCVVTTNYPRELILFKSMASRHAQILERNPVFGCRGRNKMNIQEIKKMSRIERVQTMEALWDSLIDEESEVESPEWHQDILEERKRKIESGEAEFISLKELRATRKS